METGKSIGDSAFILVYLGLAFLSFRTAWSESRREALRPNCYIWVAIGIVLLLLCVQTANRSMNLVTQIFREQAITRSWYQDRRAVQELLVRCVAIVTLTALILAAWLLRRQWRRYLPACNALAALLLYATLQAISLHRIDFWMHAHHMGLLGKTWSQLLCVLLVATALYLSYRIEGRQPVAPKVSDNRFR